MRKAGADVVDGLNASRAHGGMLLGELGLTVLSMGLSVVAVVQKETGKLIKTRI